jgi:SAM-dependent methyltransferase
LYSGVLKIVRFNWPWYALAIAATFSVLLCFYLGILNGLWTAIVITGLIVANIWLVASLVVSHYIYDRSGIHHGAWLDGINASNVGHVGIFHAGHDEASKAVALRLPSVQVQVFDFYDAGRNGAGSLERARAAAPRRDLAINLNRIPLSSGTLDLGLLVFAAHEIRDDNQRAILFRELSRVLAPAGRLIVVEHLRDVWNFLAYGPGAFHFLSRRTWCRSFADGGIKISRESSCTPFVRVFELRKST